MYIKNMWLQLFFLCEIFIFYTIVVWTVWYTHLNSAFNWPVATITSVLVYLLFISPIIHRGLVKYCGADSDAYLTISSIWQARGTGSPIHFFLSTEDSTSYVRRYWREICLTLLVLACSFLAVINAEWVKISEKLQLDSNASILSVAIWLLPLMLVFSFGLLSFMVKWNNFRAAMASAAKVMALGTIVIIMLHILLRVFPDIPLTTSALAVDKWQKFALMAWLAQFGGYIFWAWLQQLFFLGVINTSLCQTFNTTTRSGLHAVAWTTALLFALVHLPNFGLFAFTFCIGVLITYSFMRHRNLFAIAVAHAFLASLYYQLLPLSLSTQIKSYDGPGEPFLVARFIVFVFIPLTFALLMWLQGRSLSWQKVVITILFSSILAINYPNASQGPEFQWGSSGNGRTWRLHSLDIRHQGPDYTEYEVTGKAPYWSSHPLVVSPDNAHTIELDMEVISKNKSIGVIYPDFGGGYKENIYTIFNLREGRQTYRIQPKISGSVNRFKIEIRDGPGVLIRLYSLSLSAQQR